MFQQLGNYRREKKPGATPAVPGRSGGRDGCWVPPVCGGSRPQPGLPGATSRRGAGRPGAVLASRGHLRPSGRCPSVTARRTARGPAAGPCRRAGAFPASSLRPALGPRPKDTRSPRAVPLRGRGARPIGPWAGGGARRKSQWVRSASPHPSRAAEGRPGERRRPSPGSRRRRRLQPPSAPPRWLSECGRGSAAGPRSP